MDAKKSGTKKPQPRPAIDRAAIVAKVCARMEEGESLRKSCDAEGVKEQTFRKWCTDDAALDAQYARAREAGLHIMAQQIIEISDEQEVKARYNGEEVTLDLSPTAVQRNRLRVDARKWLLSKMMPKVYGDKLAIGGADDLPPVSVAAIDASQLSTEALAEIMKAKDAANRG